MNTEQHQPSMELGDSNDAAPPAPAQRLDVGPARQLSREQALLIPPSRQHELLNSVLSAGRSTGVEEAKSPTGSRPASPQDRRNPPQLQKALASWNARQSPNTNTNNFHKPAAGGSSTKPSRAKPSSVTALNFVLQRAQDAQKERTSPQPNAEVDDAVLQALRRNMKEEL